MIRMEVLFMKVNFLMGRGMAGGGLMNMKESFELTILMGGGVLSLKIHFTRAISQKESIMVLEFI